MRKLTLQEKRLLGIIAILNLAYLWKVHLEPWRAQKFQESMQRADVNREKLIKILERIHESQLLLENKKEYFGFFTPQGTIEDQLILMNNDLAQLSKTIPIIFTQILPGDIQKTAEFNTVSLQIFAEGNWSQILKFIYTLENPPNFFKIVNLSIDQNLEEEASLKIQLMITRPFLLIAQQ